MRTLSTPLASRLRKSALLRADLFEFDVGGTTYRFTNASLNLTGVSPAAAATYAPANIDRDRIRSSDGLQVDDLELTISGGTDLLGSKTWTRSALDLDLDGAPVRVFRAYLNPGAFTVSGCYLRFAGVVSQVEVGSTSLRLVVAVSANEFARPFPSLTYEESCIWNLGDAGCAWPGTVAYNVTIGADSGGDWLHIAALPDGITSSSEFHMGTVEVAGQVSSVQLAWDYPDPPPDPRMVINSGFGIWVAPEWRALQVGATAVVRRGCSHSPSVCDGTYSNLEHYMGAPLAYTGS